MANEQGGSVFSRAYNSFSGVDMKAVTDNGKPLGNLQALSYSVTREKAPVYTMGSADPRSFSRGKRGLVGTLVFIVFDRHMLLDEDYGINDMQHRPYLDAEEISSSFLGGEESLELFFGDAAGVPVEDAEPSGGFNNGVGQNYKWAAASYTDQLTPFDIVLVAANEYGKRMKMAIGGIEILNEGSGVSIDDISTEQQMTYVARGILPWRPISDA